MKKTENDINQECKELFEEIQALNDMLFGGVLKKLSDKVYLEISLAEDLNCDEDEEERKKYYEKVKKTCERKNWLKSKATPKTRKLLREVRNTVYKLPEYTTTETGILSTKATNELKKISDNLDKCLKKKDY